MIFLMACGMLKYMMIECGKGVFISVYKMR